MANVTTTGATFGTGGSQYTIDLASKFSTKVDEKFTREALSGPVVNNDYDFSGVQSVMVYDIPVVDMQDYKRYGVDRYGTMAELTATATEMKITKDRSWTFTIDKANKNQTQMVLEAGKAVSRQLSLKVVPEFDTYVFKKLAIAACAHTDGNSVAHSDVAAASTKSTAYSDFLTAQEVLGNCNVPDAGRIALISYHYAGLLKQDPTFMRECDTAQNMHIKGSMGMVDGVQLIRVPSNRLPSGCDFILTHPIACVAPKQLSEYKIHADPPGISGWRVEGRIMYDAFILPNKADAIYYKGNATVTA